MPLGISIVVPVFNEDESLEILFGELKAALVRIGRSYEIILVDDGSTDGSRSVIESLVESNPQVRAVLLRMNRGKAEALAEGFRAAQGEIVITMDADLQDVPAEIPRFLDKLDEGYDVVSGWKQDRQDPLDKTLPSRIFNAVVSRVTGVKLHDHNCGFKAYRCAAAKSLDLYGELHRFMAVLCDVGGFRVTEIPVRHRKRMHGKSKYGWGRMVNGFLDLLTVVAAIKYEARPLHVFGKFGLAFLLLGGVAGFYLAVIWAMNMLGIGEGEPVGTRPLLMASVLSILFGVQIISVGLLAEIIIRSCPKNRHLRRAAESCDGQK
ncbi:MAG: glycosyltransferase family 2 protein [Pseudomonadota bacterium]